MITEEVKDIKVGQVYFTNEEFDSRGIDPRGKTREERQRGICIIVQRQAEDEDQLKHDKGRAFRDNDGGALFVLAPGVDPEKTKAKTVAQQINKLYTNPSGE